MEDIYRRLHSILTTVADLRGATAVLTWDQETHMPEGGGLPRAHQMATLEKLGHELLTSDEVGELLLKLEENSDSFDPQSIESDLIRVTRRDYDQARKIPGKLVETMSRSSSEATQVWKKAREQNDFTLFQPHLQTLVELNREKAEALGYQERLYDALLDQFEPDVQTSHVEEVLTHLKQELIPLVKAISSKEAPDDSVLKLDYEESSQRDFVLDVLNNFGFDMSRGSQDYSAHPLTIAFSPDDVRITIKVLRNKLGFALFSAFHECGHALYYQGISGKLDRTPLNEGASHGMHESQSRFWENIIGASLPFWEYYFPRLQKIFPDQLNGTDPERFYRAINRVEPSPIRIEADEVTYNLHIILRFELENELLEGKISTGDLPERWNEKMKQYLGVVPADYASGVLQDIHWASGAFGYFPTYTIGNLMSAQIYRQIERDIPDFHKQVASGRFNEILLWLREKIHQHGRRLTANQILEKVTGSELTADSYLNYIKEKYSGIYGDLT